MFSKRFSVGTGALHKLANALTKVKVAGANVDFFSCAKRNRIAALDLLGIVLSTGSETDLRFVSFDSLDETKCRFVSFIFSVLTL